MASRKYTFYLCSDKNTNAATDKARLQKIGKALKEMGHKTKYVGVSPNSQWNANGCTKATDVLLFVCSGIDVGVLEEWGGTLGKAWKKKFKKAHPLMIKLMSGTEKRTVGQKRTINWGHMEGGTNTGFYQPLGRAKDAKYGTKLKNPAKYCEDHKISFIQGGGSEGIDDIIARLKNNEIQGAGISSINPKSNKTKKGYDTSNHFSAYLDVGYVIQYADGTKSNEKNILIDWSEEAPDNSNKWSNSENDKDISLSWVNNKHNKFEVELLSKIQSVEKKFDEKARKEDTNKYILKHIDFKSYIAKKDDKHTDEDESLLYDSKDQSTYKMLLYSLGVYSGEVINDKTLGVSSKSLLDGIKTILDETNYLFNVTYGTHRESDQLNFRTPEDVSSLNNISELEEFNEFINGNVIGISNIKFAPVSDMINSNLVIYKTVKKNEEKTATYHHTKTANLNNILRYGELSRVSKSDIVSSFAEARQKSWDEYMKNFNTQVTYTAKIAGFPSTKLNDYVQANMIDKRLTGAYQLCSLNLNMSIDSRPMLQTECGMGAIDNEISIYKNLEAQRKELIRFNSDINEPISFEDGANII